jgi:hypothetical protein
MSDASPSRACYLRAWRAKNKDKAQEHARVQRAKPETQQYRKLYMRRWRKRQRQETQRRRKEELRDFIEFAAAREFLRTLGIDD